MAASPLGSEGSQTFTIPTRTSLVGKVGGGKVEVEEVVEVEVIVEEITTDTGCHSSTRTTRLHRPSCAALLELV